MKNVITKVGIVVQKHQYLIYFVIFVPSLANSSFSIMPLHRLLSAVIRVKDFDEWLLGIIYLGDGLT
jgi:hypothetical protein